MLAFRRQSNTTPHPWVRLWVRTLLMLQRSIPPLIVILVLLLAVGIGPFAGVLTLTLGSIGMFGKFFADAIEQADKGTAESVQSVGSTRLQTSRYAILPQVLPSFIANIFYAFDNNLRAANPFSLSSVEAVLVSSLPSRTAFSITAMSWPTQSSSLS